MRDHMVILGEHHNNCNWSTWAAPCFFLHLFAADGADCWWQKEHEATYWVMFSFLVIVDKLCMFWDLMQQSFLFLWELLKWLFCSSRVNLGHDVQVKSRIRVLNFVNHGITLSLCQIQLHFFGLFVFIDRTAEDLDRKQDEREGEWHASKCPRPGVKPGSAAARTKPLFMGCLNKLS